MKCILIVDDIEENLYLLSTLFKGHGYDVVEAQNGKEALKKLNIDTIDMIVSDILMPVMDGFTFCQEVKNNMKFKEIPFIIYTATYTDPKDKKLAMSLGADAFMTKPMEPENFINEIHGIYSKMNQETHSLKNQKIDNEEVVLKLYNEVLIHKLEQKMLELEERNVNLESEVAARKKAEEGLLLALKEKDLLIREVHHRVKNNMQLINSLVSLQFTDDLNQYTPEKILMVAKELQQRIHSMALVHNLVYESKNLSTIDFNEFLHNLVRSIYNVYIILNEKIKISIDAVGIVLPITKAIPLGMIAGELLSNILILASKEEKESSIHISMSLQNSNYILVIYENGYGSLDDFNEKTYDSYGYNIISILVKQIKGTLKTYDDEDGAKIAIEFKE
ncbi:MAG: response regulator [bacterium]|nr:response regulator [bacterium]